MTDILSAMLMEMVDLSLREVVNMSDPLENLQKTTTKPHSTLTAASTATSGPERPIFLNVFTGIHSHNFTVGSDRNIGLVRGSAVVGTFGSENFLPIIFASTKFLSLGILGL